jgi:chromosome segregation protein
LISHHRNETVRLTSLSIRHEEASKAKQRELEKVQARRTIQNDQIRHSETLSSGTAEKLAAVQSALLAMDALQKQDQESHAEVEKNIQASRERLARLEAEKISLERWLSQDPVALAATALRQHALPGIHGPINELMTTSEPYQRLLDRALGDQGHYFIADTLNDAQAAVRFLSEERQGWATFLVLDRLTSGEGSAAWMDDASTRSLAVQVNCAEKFRPALQYLLGKTYYVGSTLFEETMLSGGADPEGESYQATPADLSRLMQELTALQEALVGSQERRQKLQQAIAERQAERTPLEEEKRQVQVVAQVQLENLNRLREEQQLNETEERLLQKEREESLQAITKTQQALEQEEILLTTLESEEKALQDSLQAHDASLQELRQALETHQALVSQLRVESETMRERLLGKEKEAENARGRLAALEARGAQVQAEREQNTERLTQLSASQEEKVKWLESLRTTRETQQASLSLVISQRQGIQDQVRQQEQQLSEKRQALSIGQTKAQEAEFQVRTLGQEKARMEQSLRESYQLSMEEAKVQYADVQPDAEELARVRRRLESLGAVNLAAPEEHAQLEERYQFLLTQQQDLLKAKDDLHQAIAKINATTREHFKATFEQVRSHFRMLYQTLFQGGEADLVLTDEHNLLETGIDMVAQPPGKKLQNIALLSGGEKALTAIALLFAFFMVKPSPFCLLDEVDAPLDEANVGRFLNMVKTFSEKTQFIVITHNKRSMEMADVLYGVTMAELGISSLISVKLEERKPADVVAA